MDWSKFKEFADDNSNVSKMIFVENIVGKGENAGSHNVFKGL